MWPRLQIFRVHAYVCFWVVITACISHGHGGYAETSAAVGSSKGRSIESLNQIDIKEKDDKADMSGHVTGSALVRTADEVVLFGLGDWGSPIADSYLNLKLHYDSILRSQIQSQEEFWESWYAQRNVAKVMASVAGYMSPDGLLNHGDNFYVNGIDIDTSPRYNTTFESVYSSQSLRHVKWYGVAGNHDVGASKFLCTNSNTTILNDRLGSDGAQVLVRCNSSEQVRAAMKKKYLALMNYRSPNNGRWNIKGPYYTVKFSRITGASVEVFSIDTNWALSRRNHICCQCRGYRTLTNDPSAVSCSSPRRGQKHACAPNEIFDACSELLQQWWTQSLDNLQRDLERSTADWKIVNSHYHPYYHFDKRQREQIFKVISGRVQIWMCGHSHAEAHEYHPTHHIHFLLNGGGGGAALHRNIFDRPSDLTRYFFAPAYGFISLALSKTTTKVVYWGFDRPSWQGFRPQKVNGRGKVVACHIIDVNGGAARPCHTEERSMRTNT